MKGTILLVEDEYDTREMLARAIGRAGYRCVVAAGVRDALESVGQEGNVHVVVADVVLGDDDRGGLRMLSELRKVGVHAPVIIITAYADVEKVKFALNEGAAHLLEKPFRAADLIDAIERVASQDQKAAQAFEQVLSRANLTEKEHTVARRLLEGLSSNEIAELEHNSPKTIRQHVSQIYAKCGVGSRAEFFRRMYSR